MSDSLQIEEAIIHWSEYIKDKRRKYLKKLSPQMLGPDGYITREGTQKRGFKSRGYGLGNGLSGVRVRWDKEYIKAKLSHDLKPLFLSTLMKDFFMEFLSKELALSIPGETEPDWKKDIDSIELIIEQYEDSFKGKPDSPRNAKCSKMISELRKII